VGDDAHGVIVVVEELGLDLALGVGLAAHDPVVGRRVAAVALEVNALHVVVGEGVDDLIGDVPLVAGVAAFPAVLVADEVAVRAKVIHGPELNAARLGGGDGEQRQQREGGQHRGLLGAKTRRGDEAARVVEQYAPNQPGFAQRAQRFSAYSRSKAFTISVTWAQHALA
jgi:hypothetical protein